MKRTLHLIRHGKPLISPDLPSHDWPLAPDALNKLPALLGQLQPRPQIVVSSYEAKAQATALAVARAFGIPQTSMHGLHEHLRYTAPLFERPEDFAASVARFFHSPEQVVFGEESAATARARFSSAIDAVMQRYAEHPTVAVVTHGTVRSLYVASLSRKQSALEVWKRQKLLDVISVTWLPERLTEGAENL